MVLGHLPVILPSPWPTGSHRTLLGPGMRHRPASGASSSSAGLDPSVTQEQVQLVKRVLRCSGNFYEVLEVSKTCTDD